MESYKKISLMCVILLLSIVLVTACGGGTDNANETDQGQEEPTDDANETDQEQDQTDQTDETGQAEDPTNNTELVASGEAVVQQNCLSCHGANLEGGVGPSLIGVEDRYSKSDIIKILINGKGSMPGGLANGKEEAVATYLLTLE